MSSTKFELDVMDDRAVDTENGLTEIMQELKEIAGVTAVELVALKGQGSGWPTIEVTVNTEASETMQKLADRFADGDLADMLEANAL